MTPLDNRIDEDFVARFYRGEPIVLEGVLEQKDGAAEPLDGRTFWGCIMSADGTTLHEAVAEIELESETQVYRATFDGTVTDDCFGRAGLIWSQGEHVTVAGKAARRIHAQGPLVIYPGPGSQAPAGPKGIAAIAHRIVRREVASGRSTIRISQQGARGPSPWDAKNQTLAQYQKTVLADLSDGLSDVADDGAATKIGWRQARQGAVARTMFRKLRELPVTPEDFDEYAGTGGDDTAAVQAALSVAGASVLFSPGKTYRVGELRPADAVTLQATSGGGGGGGSAGDAANRPRLLMLPGARSLIDVSGRRGVNILGLTLDGFDRSGSCITAGFSKLRVRDCYIVRGLYGIGGQGVASDAYGRTLHLSDSMVAQCETGLRNPVDTFVTLTSFASSDTNISAAGGSSSNAFAACRFEWSNSGRLVSLAGSADAKCARWDFSGCQWDRGALASLALVHADRITISGGRFERANRSGSKEFADDCLVYMRVASRVTLAGVAYAQGRDDSGGTVQTVSPSHAIALDVGCENIVINGGSSDPGFVSFLRNPTSSAASRIRLTGVGGVADYCNDPTVLQVDGPDQFRSFFGSGPIAPGASVTVTLATLLTLGTYSNRVLSLSVGARNASSGAGLAGAFDLIVRREAGNAAATLVDHVLKRPALPAAYAAPAISNPPTQAEMQAVANALAALNADRRTPPDIGLPGFGLLQLSVGAVAADGSTVDLVITNPANRLDGTANTTSYSVPRLQLR